MDQRTIILSIVAFLVLVAGMFGFTYLKQTEIMQVEEPEVTTTPEPEVAYPSVERIDGKHYFIDGVHTVVGEVVLPTPCDLLEADALVTGGTPEQVTINFTVINNADTCAQMLTVQRFKVSAEAGSDAVFKAYFIDREIPLNLIPAAPGETPDEFEVFIKG